jgi:fatty aldehyde decarbonylase
MSTTEHPIHKTSAEELRRQVREGYTAVAQGTGSLFVEDPNAQALAFGYARETIDEAPEAANLGLGCGDPTTRASLKAGETVLDLGCGAGFDVFIASRAVGPQGHVIGVDMTDELLDQAKATAETQGYDTVEFRLGTIENLPVEDASIDVVVSNCAINLSPEKPLVFAEAARVLRPNGRLHISDLIVDQELPVEVQDSIEAYVGCVGGAVTRNEYLSLVREAGFEDVHVEVAFALDDIVEPDDPRVLKVLNDSGVAYPEDEIREALHSIKGLSVSARLPVAQASCCGDTPVSEPGKGQAYTDLLSYVVSNAVAGEIMAVENYSDMVSLFDDVDAKLEAVDQAREEGRHIRLLASLGKRLNFDVKQRIIEPEWKAIRSTFTDAVRNRDLAACLIIQDLMTESMAITLYEALSGQHEVETEEVTAKVTSAILKDELEHLQIGVTRLRELRAASPGAVDRALVWAHPRVMPQLFSLVSTSCETLCDELSLECSELDPEVIDADLDLIRARAATVYMNALDLVGFPSEVSGPLLAQLASLEQDDPEIRVSTGPIECC